ncbi:hypothetical protein MPER_09927 [Moniliophthora perniciosa FA553]|nr:hypothetical protein MPER_09927 [Moniliophthora perniciosa FA553]
MRRHDLEIQPIISILQGVNWGKTQQERIIAFEDYFSFLLERYFDIEDIAKNMVKRIVGYLQDPQRYCIILDYVQALMHLENYAPRAHAFLAENAVVWITRIMYFVASPRGCNHKRLECIVLKGEVLEVCASSGWVLHSLEEKLLSIIEASEFFLRAPYDEKAETKYIVAEFSNLLESLIPHIPVHAILRRISRFDPERLERLKSASLINDQWRRLHQRVIWVYKIREAFKETRNLAGGRCSREDNTPLFVADKEWFIP